MAGKADLNYIAIAGQDTYTMFIPIGDDGVGRFYTAVLYKPWRLAALPWGEQPFDCVVFLCDPEQAREYRDTLSHELAAANLDWVQVVGTGSEELHDAIDEASVDIDRQEVVGDGFPMTSWDEDDVTLEQMADHACHCFGGEDWVLIVVVGEQADILASVAAIKKRFSEREKERDQDTGP